MMFQQDDKLSEQALILHLIQQNDHDTLKDIGLARANLNYLEPYPEIEVDTRVTPLICACFYGRLEIVKLILSNPCIDIDLASEDSGQTPLTISALTGNYEIMKLLVDGHAEVNKPNTFNQTPFICCFARLEEEKNVFENRKICIKMAELLLHYGADINWIIDKRHGYTLLMQLCSIKIDMSPKEADINYQIIKFLLENGAIRDLQSMKGKRTTELIAKHKNRDKILDLLNNTHQVYFFGKSKLSHRSVKEQSKRSSIFP